MKENQFDTVTWPKCTLGYGQTTFDYFGSIFFNNFTAGSKCKKLFDYKQYLFKNLGMLHDLFLKSLNLIMCFLML